ncbi:MAG: hypothetical protein IJ158_14000 [Treponema sp.]|nr:hypothetical protein [Treponema sp.]
MGRQIRQKSTGVTLTSFGSGYSRFRANRAPFLRYASERLRRLAYP